MLTCLLYLAVGLIKVAPPQGDTVARVAVNILNKQWGDIQRAVDGEKPVSLDYTLALRRYNEE